MKTKKTTAILAIVAIFAATAFNSCTKENGVKPASVKATSLHAIERANPDSDGTQPPVLPKS